MISAAQFADLMPGDIVTVRAVVLPCSGGYKDIGDALKLRTGDARGVVTFYAPLDQIESVEKGTGDVPSFPPSPRGFLAALSDGAVGDRAEAECLAALCGEHGRKIAA